MSKKEFINQIRKAYDLRNLYKYGKDNSVLLITGGVVFAFVAVLNRITDNFNSIMFAGAISLGIGLNVIILKNR